jgi:hypothetical protein
MNRLARPSSPKPQLPALVAVAGRHGQTRFWEFFAANIRNKNTRRAKRRSGAATLIWPNEPRSRCLGIEAKAYGDASSPSLLKTSVAVPSTP